MVVNVFFYLHIHNIRNITNKNKNITFVTFICIINYLINKFKL